MSSLVLCQQGHLDHNEVLALTVMTILTDIHHNYHIRCCHPSSPSYCYFPSSLLNIKYIRFSGIMGIACIHFLFHLTPPFLFSPPFLAFYSFVPCSFLFFIPLSRYFSFSLNQLNIISSCFSVFVSRPCLFSFAPMFRPSSPLISFDLNRTLVSGCSKHLQFLG